MELPQVLIDHINTYWKPNQDDSFIKLTNDSEHYSLLESWFKEKEPETIDVGPFIGIKPYGMFPDETHDDWTEFLFIYETIDNGVTNEVHIHCTSSIIFSS